MVRGDYPRRVVWIECQWGGMSNDRLVGTGYPGSMGSVDHGSMRTWSGTHQRLVRHMDGWTVAQAPAEDYIADHEGEIGGWRHV